MAVSKVVYGGRMLMDLTGDSVTEDALVQGYTAHDAAGNAVDGANPYEKAATDAEVLAQEQLLDEIVEELAKRCVVTEPLLQARTVTPTEEVQVVTPDAGYDGLSSVTVEAAQGGEGTYGWKKCVSKLPSGYTEVEYIQSSGTQYINTGFTPNQDTRVVVDFKIQGGTNEVLFGARTSSSADGICFYKRTTGYYASQYNDTTSDTSVANDTSRHVVDKNKNVTHLDGTSVLTHTAGTFSAPNTMTLFASNDNGTVKYYANATIYSCQIYDNGNLVRDFIPCTNPDGVAGLYDAENGVFYTNAGTGTFFSGNPIRNDLPSGYTQIEYIQSDGTQYIDTGLIVNKSDTYEYILDAIITNAAYGGCNGYMQFTGDLSNGKRVKIKVVYNGNTCVETVYVDDVLVSTQVLPL